jgi:ADP-ribose pyrophosphatase YjhB (NUDIX family)
LNSIAYNYIHQIRDKIGTDLLLIPSVTNIVMDTEKRILLVKDADSDMWTTPGGGVEPIQTPADAAVREMWEETGLFVKPMRIVGVYGGADFLIIYSNGDQASYVLIAFECRINGGKLAPNGVETLEVGYFSRSTLTELQLPPWVRIVISDAFKTGSSPQFKTPTWTPPVV